LLQRMFVHGAVKKPRLLVSGKLVVLGTLPLFNIRV